MVWVSIGEAAQKLLAGLAAADAERKSQGQKSPRQLLVQGGGRSRKGDGAGELPVNMTLTSQAATHPGAHKPLVCKADRRGPWNGGSGVRHRQAP